MFKINPLKQIKLILLMNLKYKSVYINNKEYTIKRYNELKKKIQLLYNMIFSIKMEMN